MNSLIIGATKVTPEINFDIENSTLSLLKVSKPEDAISFYKPLFDFIDQFRTKKIKTKEVDKITIDFKFEYFNTASSKVIYELLERFIMIKDEGVEICVNWFYHPDDEDMLEDGEVISEALELPFNFFPTEE